MAYFYRLRKKMELRIIEGGNICQTDIRTTGHVTELTLYSVERCIVTLKR